MLSTAFVILTIMSVTSSVESTPSYTVSFVDPFSDYSEKIDDVYVWMLHDAYLKAVRDVNNYFGQNFTLRYSLLYSAVDSNLFINQFLRLLASASPPVALIGPFYLDRIRSIAPLAEMSRVALVSPWISLSQMSRFLPRSNRVSLSMQAAQNTHGDELIKILQHHDWSDIALIITKTPLQLYSLYEQNVKNVRFPAETVDVTVVATAWIPPLDDYGNDTVTFEAAVTQELEKIWRSGATVIVLSIEQTPTTYEVLMQAANKFGLLNSQTAWISLTSRPKSDWNWLIYRVHPNYRSLLDGMIVTTTDLTDYFKTPLSVKPSEQYIFCLKYTLICQLVYDSVWAVAFAINKSMNEGVPIVGHNVQIGEVQFQRWTSGENLIKNIKETEFVGLSGLVSFNYGNVRLTWIEMYNIRYKHIYGYYVGYCGPSDCEFKYPIYWHNGSIRSPTGEVNICRHRMNVLLPGGRYGRYIDFSDNKKDRKYFGWAVDLFEKAAKSNCLSNFEYHISNMTWDEAIELVGSGHHSSFEQHENIEFHVAVGPFAITSERNANADFTSSIKSVSYRVAILHPEPNRANLWEFINPFSWQLWLLTAAFFVASGIFLFLLEKKRKRLPGNAPRVLDSIFVSMSALFYTHDQTSILSNSGRGYLAIVCFVVLILCACFTANLSVFLLKRQLGTSTYTKFEDIHDGVIGASKVTGALAYLQHHYQKLVFEDVSSEDWLKRLRSKEIAAYVDDSSALEFIARTNCDLLLLSEKLHVVNAAFALKQNSPYKEKLNRGILEAWFDKFIEDLEQKYFEWVDECQEPGEVVADEPLTLDHLGGLFIILSAVAVLCILGDFLHRCVRTVCYGNPAPRPSGVSAVEENAVEKTLETSICFAGDGSSNDWTLKRSAEVTDEQLPDLLRQSLVPPSGRGPLPPIDL